MLFRSLVSELGVAIEDFTDPQKAQELRKKLAHEAKHPKPIPSVNDAYEEEPVPKSPTSKAIVNSLFRLATLLINKIIALEL